MADLALYLDAKDSTVKLVTALSADDLNRTCQACPAWSIRDVVAHHVHFVGAFIAGDVPSSMYTAMIGDTEASRQKASRERDQWTHAGVTARHEIDFAIVLDEWHHIAARMDDGAARTILDLTMHLYDIKETLSDSSGQDSPLIDNALRSYYYRFLTPRLAQSRLVANLEATDIGTSLAADQAAPTITGSAYDLLRTIGGRRTKQQANDALDWGDSQQALRDLFAVYGWPADDQPNQ